MGPEDVYKAIDRLVGFVLRYAVTLAAVSAFSMALLESVKALLSWRDRFHKRHLLRWVNSISLPREACEQINWHFDEAQFNERVYAKLLRLTTGETPGGAAMVKPIEWTPWVVSAGNALFALSLDKMMGQIQDAADTALGNPHVYPELYLFLTAGADLTDIANWFRWAQEPPARSTEDAKTAKTQADTYARLRQLIRRRLDAFQVTTSYRWETGNQVASVLLGAVVLFGSLVYLTLDKPPKSSLEWIGLAFVSLTGGILAPVAKDLVIALKKVRSGV